MRKISLICVVALAALSTASCGKSSEVVETGAIASEAAAGEAHAMTETKVSGEALSSGGADDEEFIDTDFFDGLITAIDESLVRLESEDGETRVFDISGAEVFEDDGPVLRGSYAEAEYPEGQEQDIFEALSLIILMDIEQQADMEERDPVIYGTLQLMDINELLILDDAGFERSFDNQMSRTVSFGNLKAGDEVAVTYAGDLLDTDGEKGEGELSGMPYAIKIVSVDALSTEEAEANYLTGIMDEVYSDGVIKLVTEGPSLYIEADPSLYEGFDEGARVKVYYLGQISGMMVTADRIESLN